MKKNMIKVKKKTHFKEYHKDVKLNRNKRSNR